MIAACQFDAFVRLNDIARGLLGIAAGMVAHGAVNGEIALSPVSIAYSTRSRTPFRSDGGQHYAVMADAVPG